MDMRMDTLDIVGFKHVTCISFCVNYVVNQPIAF